MGMFAGNGALGLAAVLVSTVISPFTIPLTLQLLLGASVQIDVAGMMTQMIFMIALPALAGTALNDVTRGWGHKRLSPAINPACRLLLLLIITTNSTSMSPYVLHMTWERVAAMLFILLFTTSGFFWGLIAARVCRRALSQPHHHELLLRAAATSLPARSSPCSSSQAKRSFR